MKTIKFTPRKLDKLADQYFQAARHINANSMLRRENDSEAQAKDLAGIALRRWAQQIRDARKLAKIGRD